MLTKHEKKVLSAIQENIPVTRRPYLKIASELGLKENQVLEILNDLCLRGIIRRFGATIRHQKSGFTANAMTAWNVEDDRVEQTGKIMALSKHVSHCYARISTSNWPYNLYTMIHGKDRKDCQLIADTLAKQTKIKDYTLLFSKKELKKTSMKYFPAPDIPVLNKRGEYVGSSGFTFSGKEI
jgi:siroheme decarboxylase